MYQKSMASIDTVKKVSKYVTSLMNTHLPDTMYFHSLQHTIEVVDAVTLISNNHSLNSTDLGIVQIAAWFHDSGYIFNYSGHEESSMAVAGTYLMQHEFGKNFIQEVLNCIEATKFPQTPNSLLQQIICDADLFHFSQIYYTEHAQKLKKEWETYLERYYTQDDWNRLNLEMLLKHRYFTEFGRNDLQYHKQKNIAILLDATSID